MPLLHVYRRGHIFWWRRVHRLSGGWTLDVRLSLKTADRGEARNRGAALTAATGGVIAMLHQRILKDSAQLTEDDLRAMAKQAYEELLVELCTSQRLTPYEADMHSASNLAFMDYYQRLAFQGGRKSFLPNEEQQLVKAGWQPQRIADLRSIIRMIEAGNDTKLSPGYVDYLLLKHGFVPDVRSSNMTELALYPAFRDAHLDAEVELQRMIDPLSRCGETNAIVEEPTVPATCPIAVPADPRCMSEFVEEAIRDQLADEIWDDKTGRQARSTVALFELLIGKKPFASYTQAEFTAFKRKTRCLPERYDMTSEKSRANVLVVVAARENDTEFAAKGNKEARSNTTRNRHLSSLKGVHLWAKKSGMVVPEIDFSSLFIPLSKARRGRNLRPPTPKEDVARLFALPIFTGCQPHPGGTGQIILRARFTSGPAVVHDAFYWVPLLTYYTGARREEICKLRPEDIFFVGEIAYILIDFTPFGRLKNDHSVRPVPLHSEVLRLGFRAFVGECSARGYPVLFPELMPTNKVQNFGDVFSKNAWKNIIAKGDLTEDATIHGMRHRFSTDLKAAKVFSEFRRDLMGHGGANLTEEIYSDTGPLLELQAVVEELPAVTQHLICADLNLPPRAIRTPQPRKKRRKVD